MMRATCLVALLCSTSVIVASSAQAQKPVDVGLAVAPGTITHVRLQSGSVRLTGWDRDSVHVSGLLAPGETWAMRVDGDTVRLRAEGLPRGLAAPSELDIFVPMSSALVVRAAAASLVVSDFTADVDVATAAGNLLVEKARAIVRAETMQGTLTVFGPSPRVEASTASGALLVSVPYDTINDVPSARAIDDAALSAKPFGVVILRTVSGRITFDAAGVDSAMVHSVRGDVRVTAVPTAAGVLRVDSHAGRVVLGVESGAASRFDLRSLRGVVRGGAPAGGSGGQVIVRAVRGDVVVEDVVRR